MDEDGYITIVDRAKDMLIVGGYKVFSREVEEHFISIMMLNFVLLSAYLTKNGRVVKLSRQLFNHHLKPE